MEPMRSSSPLARLAQSERENRRLRDESHSSARALGNSTISRGVLVVEEDGSIVSDSTTVGTRIVEGRVEVRQSPEDEWIPILDPSNLPDPTDGLPPTTAPVPVALPFAVGAVQVSWPDISNPDPVLGYEVAAKSTTPVPTDGSATLPGLRGSGTTLSELSGVDVPTDGSPVYVTVRAVDSDGPGPWSVEVSAAARVVDFEQVSQAIKDSIIAADDKAVAAQGDATTAIADALAAANAAATADGKAVTAQSAASTADGKAVAAQTDADQAIADALAAAAAAQTAQNVADDAIRTWYQATAPTGLNDTTDLGDLWFDTDDDQAYRWGGSGPGWILIQDNAIAVALANAATAQDAADAAQAKADAAATPANVEAARIAAEAAAALDATTKADAAINAAATDATTKANAAREAAETAAALDATAKAEAAESAAAATAALDAQAKADAAADAAEQAAKDYADTVSAGEGSDALAAAKLYAEQKANDARIAAESAAALDATAKAEAAESDAAATAAADATTKADNAKSQAITAAATDATTKANNAEAAAEAAAAITAQAKADLAKSQAIDSAASTAQTKADVAKDEAIADAAIAAQTKADDARDAAISDAVAKVAAAKSQAIAAAKVESDKKGKVIIQSAAPDAADRLVQNLWIDTTGGANTPKRWTSGTTWVAVTDKVAVDAAAAAVVAKDAADAAQADATTAIDSANGKNTRRSGPAIADGSTPTTPVGAVAGDTYWGRLAGVVKQQWVYDGTTWSMETVDVTVIANLDSDFITARLLEVDTILARIIAAGEITTGELAAGAVTAAKIQGQAIDGMTITGATVRTASAGLRTQLDLIGLRTFEAGGAESARLSADSGGMRLSGTLDMRDATGTGLLIEPDVDFGSAIRFFENNLQVGSLTSAGGGVSMDTTDSSVALSGFLGSGIAQATSDFTVKSGDTVNIIAPHLNFAASEVEGVLAGTPTVSGLELPKSFQAGSKTISFTTRASYTTYVAFPQPFDDVPAVLTNIASGSGSTGGWGSRSFGTGTDGFTLWVFGDADAWSGVEVTWIAVKQS